MEGPTPVVCLHQADQEAKSKTVARLKTDEANAWAARGVADALTDGTMLLG